MERYVIVGCADVSDYGKVENALLTAGVIQPHFDERLNPLGALSSKSHEKNEKILRLF